MPASDLWSRRIRRARELAAAHAATRPLLEFYAELLSAQQDVYASLRGRHDPPSGSLDRDVAVLRVRVPALVQVVAARGPEPLVTEARQLLDGPTAALDDLLLTWWRAPSDRQFFPKAALQPYAQWLADSAVAPQDRGLPRADNRCPFCGGAPQLSVLETGGDADGGGRRLLCANCLTMWPFRRVLCAWCGEEDERKLGYFRAPEFDHLRLDACESCRHYVKTVDLTRLGLAVPLVDEIAGAPLDLWARDRGYEKIELNLLGL